MERVLDKIRPLIMLALWCPFVAACISGVAAAFLLSGLRRLPADRKKKLLPRQLWHLALADLSYAIVECLSIFLDMAVQAGWEGPSQTWLKSGLCEASYFAYLVCLLASLMVECHIALSFVASIFKNTRALLALNRGLLFAWPLAGVSALGSGLFGLGDMHWGTSGEFACVSLGGEDWIRSVSLWLAIVTCFVCYVISACRVRTAGEAVQASVFRRMRNYLLVALVFTLPSAVFGFKHGYVLNFDEKANHVGYIISETMLNFKGLLNFAVYALQSRYASQLRVPASRREEVSLQQDAGQTLDGSGDEPIPFSYRVGFRGGPDSLRSIAPREDAPRSDFFETDLGQMYLDAVAMELGQPIPELPDEGLVEPVELEQGQCAGWT